MNLFAMLRFEMFLYVISFITQNSGDFTPGGIVLTQLAVLQAVVAAIQSLIGDKAFGFSESQFGTAGRALVREQLRHMLETISETARSMVYAYPGIDKKFRMPRNRNNAELLAKAKAFLMEADPYKNSFIDDFKMPDNFLTELQNLIDAFEQALGSAHAATGTHVEATAEIAEQIRKGMIAVRTMHGVVKNTYRGDAGKTAAWYSAKHIRKQPENINEPPPAP